MTGPVVIASADRATADALSEMLGAAGFDCMTAVSAEACAAYTRPPFAGVVLHDADTLTLTSEIDAPRLSLATPGHPADATALIKPFRRAKLIRLLRRMTATAPAETPLSLAGGWTLNRAERALKHESATTIPLTEKETTLLACLLARPSGEASRQELLEHVWGYGEDINTRTLETHIYRLRLKLKPIAADAEAILGTEAGYRIVL